MVVRQEAILLNSEAFKHHGAIPERHTCDGQEISPPLEFDSVPENTVSLALIMHDPDAPSGDFTHWVVWNIPPGTRHFEEGHAPGNTRQGMNDFNRLGYGGPCPPSGTHRYMFDIYAVDTMLELPEGATRSMLEQELRGHVVARGQLIGTYSR